MKISVVMSYFNRRNLLLNTLKTISNYKNDPEIIIVDDASDEENEISDLTGYLNLNIKIIRVEQQQKTWYNSCVPFNIGFRESTGDIIIIQCPECMHIGDIVGYASNNVIDNTYLSFSCYSVDKEKLICINETDMDAEDWKQSILNIIEPVKKSVPSRDCENGWYNHSMYNPCAHHFCSAITRKDLNELGGFDERYAGGLAYEDREIIRRIRSKGMNIKIIDDPFVIHQAHKPTDYNGKRHLFLRNEHLYFTNENIAD